MMKLAIVGLDLGPGSFGGVNNYTKLLLDNIDKNLSQPELYQEIYEVLEIIITESQINIEAGNI